MQIHLVRHGETRENIARRHQPNDTPLTANGIVQAEKVAKEIKEIKPTHLISSTLVRAVETARIVGEECEMIPQTSAHFIELSRPEHLYGRRHASLFSMWFYIQWCLGRDTGSKDLSESYKEVRARIKRSQEYLAALPKDSRVVVVSHSVFISLFVAHLCRDKSLSLLQGIAVFRKMLTMPNAEITTVTLNTDSAKGTCAWSVNNIA